MLRHTGLLCGKKVITARMVLIRAGMLILAAIAGSLLLGLAVACRELGRAPEGFEDKNGFHIGRPGPKRRQSYTLQPISSNLPKAPVY
jgi:hypothetical protein